MNVKNYEINYVMDVVYIAETILEKIRAGKDFEGEILTLIACYFRQRNNATALKKAVDEFSTIQANLIDLQKSRLNELNAIIHGFLWSKHLMDSKNRATFVFDAASIYIFFKLGVKANRTNIQTMILDLFEEKEIVAFIKEKEEFYIEKFTDMEYLESDLLSLFSEMYKTHLQK